MKTFKCARAIVGILAMFFLCFWGVGLYAENSDGILSKDDAAAMFTLSRKAWEDNARQIKAAGVGAAPVNVFLVLVSPNPFLIFRFTKVEINGIESKILSLF